MSDQVPNAQAGSPFWQFSLRFYRDADVAAACIALQDEAGVDVNLLLFLLWLASQSRALAFEEVKALDDKIAPWRETTVIPLRQVRRALRTPPTLVEKARAELFRTRIKAVELEAERLQQEAMYTLAQARMPGTSRAPAEAARLNVLAYQGLRAVAFPPDAVATLLAAFERMPLQSRE